MNKKKLQVFTRREGSLLIVKILNETRELIYKTKINIKDKEKIRIMIDSLKGFGVNINEILKEKKEKRWW